MDMLDLPKFDVPENLPDKKYPMEVVCAWWDENLRHLKETGQYDKLQRDPSRQPSDEPFVLD